MLRQETWENVHCVREQSPLLKLERHLWFHRKVERQKRICLRMERSVVPRMWQQELLGPHEQDQNQHPEVERALPRPPSYPSSSVEEMLQTPNGHQKCLGSGPTLTAFPLVSRFNCGLCIFIITSYGHP